MRKINSCFFLTLLGCVLLNLAAKIKGEEIPVLHQEGLVHGFLVLRTPEGEILANGALNQVAHASKVTAKLMFHFRDGSFQEETTTYSQLRTFRLLTDHLVQKGPAFKDPKDVSIDARSGQVTVRTTGEDGKAKVRTDHLTLPADLSNGLLFTLLKNVPPSTARTEVSLLAVTPKLRIVKLVISPNGEDPFMAGEASYRATHYVVKIKLGGVTGAVAPLLDKQPPDIHVWIFGGDAPAFVKSEGPLYNGGPIWRVELASPVWHSKAEGLISKDQPRKDK